MRRVQPGKREKDLNLKLRILRTKNNEKLEKKRRLGIAEDI